MHTISLTTARAAWRHRQRLTTGAPDPIQALQQAGYIRTLGGIDAYLALYARVPELERSTVDALLNDHEIHVGPAARGCIYLTPGTDVPLALAFARQRFDKQLPRDLEKAGSSMDEVRQVAEAVLDALSSAPLSPAGIRKALPEGRVRSLGAAGKKVGMSSVLPACLRLLEFDQQVIRTSASASLLSENYLWKRVEAPVFGPSPTDPDAISDALVSRYLSWAAPASVSDIASWIGTTKRAVKGSLKRLAAESIEIEGYGETTFIPAGEMEGVLEAKPSTAVSFLPFHDLYVSVHRLGHLVHEAFQDHPVAPWGPAKTVKIRDARFIHQRPIVQDDMVVGFWDYDIDTDEVVWGTFDTPDAARLQTVADALTPFIRDQLGSAKSYTLDNDKSMRARVAAVRGLAHAS